MKYILLIGIIVVALPGCHGMTQASTEMNDCRQIAEATARLKCFDQQFPRGDVDNRVDNLVHQTDQATLPPQTHVQVEEPVTPQPSPGHNTQKQTAHSKPKTTKRMFAWDESLNLTTALKEVRKKDQQKMIFLLENGQIWIQSSPRSLPIAAGERITIKNTAFGGYMLRTKAGTATRVSRIK